MQIARLFLMYPPPRWLTGVLCYVIAGLPVQGKSGPRLLTSILSLINKIGFQPLPNYVPTLSRSSQKCTEDGNGVSRY